MSDLNIEKRLKKFLKDTQYRNINMIENKADPLQCFLNYFLEKPQQKLSFLEFFDQHLELQQKLLINHSEHDNDSYLKQKESKAQIKKHKLDKCNRSFDENKQINQFDDQFSFETYYFKSSINNKKFLQNYKIYQSDWQKKVLQKQFNIKINQNSNGDWKIKAIKNKKKSKQYFQILLNKNQLILKKIKIINNIDILQLILKQNENYSDFTQSWMQVIILNQYKIPKILPIYSINFQEQIENTILLT